MGRPVTCTCARWVVCDACIAAHELATEQLALEASLHVTRDLMAERRGERREREAREAFKRPILDAFDRLSKASK